MDVKSVLTGMTGSKLNGVINSINAAELRDATEIRIRTGKPVIVGKGGVKFFLSEDGKLIHDPERAYSADAGDVSAAVELISGHSLYAFGEELRNGYITVPGGHRVGMAGKAVVENGAVRTVRSINALNVRISRQIIGCGDKVLKYITEPLRHTLIVSPPACGKTTLLRDLVRSVSGMGINAGIVDERSEIAGCYMGVPQNDVGYCTDVLDACPKAEGMLIMLRAMTPEVIAVDEIGKKEDIQAIGDIVNAGIKLFCTVHGNGTDDVRDRPDLSELIRRKVFGRYIVLRGGGAPGRIEGVYGGEFNRLWGGYG